MDEIDYNALNDEALEAVCEYCMYDISVTSVLRTDLTNYPDHFWLCVDCSRHLDDRDLVYSVFSREEF